MDFIEYNGKRYSIKKIYKLIDMYENSQVDGVIAYCPLCQVDFFENGLFMCEECLKIKYVDERCDDHYLNSHICKDCCEECEGGDYVWRL